MNLLEEQGRRAWARFQSCRMGRAQHLGAAMTKSEPILISIDELLRDLLTHLEKLRWLQQEFAAEVERANRAPSGPQKAWLRRAGLERAKGRARRQRSALRAAVLGRGAGR